MGNTFTMNQIHREIMQIMKEAKFKHKDVTYSDIFNPIFATKRYLKKDIIDAMNDLEENGYYLCMNATGKIDAISEIELTDKGNQYILRY